MQLSEDLRNYLNSSYTFIHSNILFTDLNKILLTYTNKLNDNFADKTLGKDILRLIDNWKNNKGFDDNFICKNDFLYKIIENDETTYSAQMIFPIYHNEVLDGLIIFFRQLGTYIPSSCKAPKTLRYFAEIMSDDNYSK